MIRARTNPTLPSNGCADILAELRAMFPALSDATFNALLREEKRRIVSAKVERWDDYRALSRAGSAVALTGRQKKAIYSWLAIK